ncbi:hypothetical protein [Serratia plymuthica]|uniref:hypothetical protein n=1 Tax=Serratia plymuthica TaxID=82996 RepID=UPI0018D5CB36|nr:hypothetical protein [Serratia plymuthica]QPS58549.1 hypothetical protein I6G53_11845 [Serratia plymuthica]CAI1919011.1 Uncharacterised protein [Serratia plymuthica]
MAVPIQTPYNIYTANGVTTVFPYEFLILDAGDLTVSINGAPVSSGFSITGVGTTNGGEVIFLTPPTSGATVMNLRDIPATRLINYQDNGDLLAATVPCKTADVARPAFAVDQLPIGALIDAQMRALRAERHQRIGYERELLAANEACKF